MKYFHYTGVRDNGVVIKGWLLVENRDAAVQVLRRRQVQPLNVKQAQGQIPLKVPVEELLASLRELASLRASGMALDKSIEAIASTVEDATLKRAWTQTLQSIRSGLSLSDALAASPDAFPRYAVPMVKLGEANGELKSVLHAVADRLEEEISLKNEVYSALTYPAFLLLISVVVLMFLFLVVIPKFGSMMGNMEAGQMRTLVTFSNALLDSFWIWGSMLLVLGLMLARASKEGLLQVYLWKILQRIPGVKKLLEAWEVVQFTSSMRRLLHQKVAILEALALSSETLGREELKRQLQLSEGNMRRGDTLAKALEEYQAFPPMVIQMIGIGESAANLPDSLGEISKLYERRLREGIRRTLALLEPIVIVTLGLIVGGIMVTLLSGIISMNDLPI